MFSRDRLGGVILCGGYSRRMGAPKEWMRVDGEFVLSRVARELRLVAPQVVVAAREGQELPPLPEGVRVANDTISEAGPLAGLAAGMEALKDHCDAIIVAPCDHPWISAAFLRRLVEELGEAPAVVPQQGDRVFALLGVYRTSLLPLLISTLEQQNYRARDFAWVCGAKLMDAESLRDIDPELLSLRNVNAFADWPGEADNKCSGRTEN